jgi:hypothetical protein
MGANPQTITGTFNSVAPQPTKDSFVLDLAAGTVTTQ